MKFKAVHRTCAYTQFSSQGSPPSYTDVTSLPQATQVTATCIAIFTAFHHTCAYTQVSSQGAPPSYIDVTALSQACSGNSTCMYEHA